MYRTFVLAIACCLVVPACGGGNGGSGETSADAEADLSAMDQLNGLSVELQAGLDTLMQPINDTQSVIDDITSMPARLNIDAASLMSMASATMESGTVSIAADFNAEAAVRAEVEAVLTKLQGIVAGLKATPERVQQMSMTLAQATAKLPVLATQVTTSAQAKLANPLGSAESKAQAQADLNAVAGVQANIQAQISDVQAKVTGIPVMATEALAKLAASFAGGASAGT
jgi:hypothetical protein